MDRQAVLTVDEDIGQTGNHQFPSVCFGPTATHLGELVQAFTGCPDRLGNPMGGLGIIGSDEVEHAAQVLYCGQSPSGHLTPRIC